MSTQFTKQATLITGGEKEQENRRQVQEKVQNFLDKQIAERPELISMGTSGQISVLTPLLKAECPIFVRMFADENCGLHVQLSTIADISVRIGASA